MKKPTAESFNTPGPTPGPDRVVTQHTGMAISGMIISPGPCRTELHQATTKTGKTHAPGLTSTAKRGKN